VLGVWIPKKGEWVKAFGLADIATQEKMTINDHFRIGSITKTFVAMGILQLVDKGKLSLDDPIGKYIANVPNGDKITIRQLANMTSGLPSYTKNKTWLEEFLKDKKRVWTTQELLDAAFSLPPSFNPGEGFEYCNTNTILLGLVIEKLSGLSLNAYLEKNIFNPLKLNNTSLPTGAEIPKPYAHGYAELPDNTLEDESDRNTSWSFAAGGMVSILHDLKIFTHALGTGSLLSKDSAIEQLKWKSVGPNTEKVHYAFGIGVNNGWLSHAGTLPGYNTIIAYLPEQEAIFICLVNTDKNLKVNDKTTSAVNLIFEKIAEIIFPHNIPLEVK